MKILLAVDGSEYTKKMLAYMATHEELFNPAHKYVLITVQAQLPSRARAAVGKDVVETYQREEAERILAPSATFLTRHGINAKSIAKVGHAAEVIARTAETGKFDLLVMGSHGHGTLGNLVMGSVATKVLANSKVPVLLVR